MRKIVITVIIVGLLFCIPFIAWALTVSEQSIIAAGQQALTAAAGRLQLGTIPEVHFFEAAFTRGESATPATVEAQYVSAVRAFDRAIKSIITEDVKIPKPDTPEFDGFIDDLILDHPELITAAARLLELSARVAGLDETQIRRVKDDSKAIRDSISDGV